MANSVVLIIATVIYLIGFIMTLIWLGAAFGTINPNKINSGFSIITGGDLLQDIRAKHRIFLWISHCAYIVASVLAVIGWVV